MSIITKIDGIPLFSTKEQALRWGKSKGVLGHHEHTHFGQKGYMAGVTHSDVYKANYFTTKSSANLSIVKLSQELYTIEDVTAEQVETPVEQVIEPQPQLTVTQRIPVATGYSGSGSSGVGGSGGSSGGGGGGY
jgi:hypothetical protein